jgi:hypothetical protein
VNLVVNQDHRDFFTIAIREVFVIINRHLAKCNAIVSRDNIENDGTGIVTQVTSVATYESHGDGHEKLLLLVATLVASLTKQLTVLLLRHTLATLLND